ncbi:MAG: HAD hydrolase-like protein [Bdellovibrionaceae bacterium]|nr:HAD hydrolase-like protein [Pseudobdellovibrionaceae bacterium]MBX3032676.1 HAD hydrolase-like protein [Pseudobdellovibrionaceae bacterium]
MIRLLCFDLDGTLIDSAGDISSAVNKTLREHGKQELAHEVIVSHIGEGLKMLITGVFPEVTDHARQELLIERFLENYENDMTRTTTVFPGVFDFIEKWLSDGGRIGLITNKNEKPTRALMQHYGLERFPWQGIFGADTLAERKPSALPLQTMMARAGFQSHQTLMIGDGTPDMASAQAAGVGAVAIGFGYTRIEILNKYQPLGIIGHYRELPALIASLC